MDAIAGLFAARATCPICHGQDTVHVRRVESGRSSGSLFLSCALCRARLFAGRILTVDRAAQVLASFQMVATEAAQPAVRAAASRILSSVPAGTSMQPAATAAHEPQAPPLPQPVPVAAQGGS